MGSNPKMGDEAACELPAGNFFGFAQQVATLNWRLNRAGVPAITNRRGLNL